MRGYQNDDGIVRADSARHAYRTGDVATRDADGYFTYVGRADDVFKASDYRISPFELESVLIEHPAVAEAAVVPAPDPVRMAVPKAYVTLAAGARPTARTALSIFRHLRERLAPFKRVRRHRVRRTAEDDFRQDPPRRTAPGRGGARGQGRRSGANFARRISRSYPGPEASGQVGSRHDYRIWRSPPPRSPGRPSSSGPRL